jgi:hypothetical protein
LLGLRVVSLAAHFVVYSVAASARHRPGASRLREIDVNLPMINVRIATEQIDRLFARERFFATLGSFFGVLALLLSADGASPWCARGWQ